MKCRVNGTVFGAFACLYMAVLAIAAFFASLNIIGFTHSSLVSFTEGEPKNMAAYTYIAEGETYGYAVETYAAASIFAPQSETVFYFREFPGVRTKAVNIVVYPVAVALFGAGFSLLIKLGQTQFKENSAHFGDYIVFTIISAASLIPACICVCFACNFYTSEYNEAAAVSSSVNAASVLLGIIGANLLMWGIAVKVREYKLKNAGLTSKSCKK